MKSLADSKHHINLWVIVSMIFVLLMVLVGGLTRLTESGLSITEWQVFTGILPPFGELAWQEMFLKYQKIPEFIIENNDMNLSEFKQIFWYEYVHRLLGRITGVVILIPALYILFKSKIDLVKNQILLLVFLVPMQGLMGWLMVKSGLSVRTDVSHLRLACHFLMALFIFLVLLEIRLRLASEKRALQFRFNIWSVIFCLLIVQIIWGAFVAGLRAGYIYNSYPLMGEKFLPQELFFFASLLENFFYNSTNIQFVHRHLGFIIFLITIFSVYKKRNTLREGRQISDAILLLIFLFVQFILGVTTLLTGVNIILALLHQLCAVILIGRSYICMRRVLV